MAPLTYTSFNDWTVASLWPRPIFLLAAGSVALLLFILRRRLTARRYLRYVETAKCKTDEIQPLSDLPPPLRSVYYHQNSGENANKTSSILAMEAAIEQLQRQRSNPKKPSRRYSCPLAPSAVYERPTIEEEPPAYSQLMHDSVQYFPVLDGEGKGMEEKYWRRRTLIYA